MDLFIFEEFKLNMYFEVLKDDALIRVVKFLSKQKPYILLLYINQLVVVLKRCVPLYSSIVLQISEIRKESLANSALCILPSSHRVLKFRLVRSPIGNVCRRLVRNYHELDPIVWCRVRHA